MFDAAQYRALLPARPSEWQIRFAVLLAGGDCGRVVTSRDGWRLLEVLGGHGGEELVYLGPAEAA